MRSIFRVLEDTTNVTATSTDTTEKTWTDITNDASTIYALSGGVGSTTYDEYATITHDVKGETSYNIYSVGSTLVP